MMCCYSILRPQKYRIHPTGEITLNFTGGKNTHKNTTHTKKLKTKSPTKIIGIRGPLKSLINLPARLKICYGPSQFHGF